VNRFLTAHQHNQATLEHAGKYRTEDKFKTHILQKLDTTQKSKQRIIQQNKNKTTLV